MDNRKRDHQEMAAENKHVASAASAPLVRKFIIPTRSDASKIAAAASGSFFSPLPVVLAAAVPRVELDRQVKKPKMSLASPLAPPVIELPPSGSLARDNSSAGESVVHEFRHFSL